MQALIYLGIGFRSIEFKSELYNNSLFRQYLTVESFVFPVFLLIYLLLSLQILKRCNTETHFWQKDLKLWLLPFQKHRLSLPVGTKVYEATKDQIEVVMSGKRIDTDIPFVKVEPGISGKVILLE